MDKATTFFSSAVFFLSFDLFGAGVRPTEVKDKRQHTGELYKDREKMRVLMKGALETAKSKGANIDNAVVFGYCFGGAAVLELARSGENMRMALQHSLTHRPIFNTIVAHLRYHLSTI